MDALRDIDYPSCAHLVHLLRICVCAHECLNCVAQENVYIRRGLRVVGFDIKAMREPQVVELARASFTLLFLYPILKNILLLRFIEIAR